VTGYMRDWLERPGEPASDLDLVVLGPLVRQVLAGLHRPGKRAARYDALFARLQPVRLVSRLGSHELFQWAGRDIFVSASVRKQFAVAAPLARVDFYPTADHQLTSAAQTARDAFLAKQLRLSG
jgi:hypothetical protein